MDNYHVVGDPNLAPDVPEDEKADSTNAFMGRGGHVGKNANELFNNGQYWIDRGTTTPYNDNFPSSGRYGFLTTFNHTTNIPTANNGVIVQEFQPYASGTIYRRNRINNSWTAWSEYHHFNGVQYSHIGQIIETTALDTLAKVQAIYGSNTTWIQHTGYVLRGATSGVVANSAVKTGGNDTHTLTVDEMPSHGHGNASQSMNRNNPHTHYMNYPTPNGDVMGIYGGGGNRGWGLPLAGGNNNNYGILSNQATDVNHEHGIVSQGGGQAFNILPQYKSVYIWERTA